MSQSQNIIEMTPGSKRLAVSHVKDMQSAMEFYTTAHRIALLTCPTLKGDLHWAVDTCWGIQIQQ